jgi:hypothetical protein
MVHAFFGRFSATGTNHQGFLLSFSKAILTEAGRVGRFPCRDSSIAAGDTARKGRICLLLLFFGNIPPNPQILQLTDARRNFS